jgi:hypothetical protein
MRSRWQSQLQLDCRRWVCGSKHYGRARSLSPVLSLDCSMWRAAAAGERGMTDEGSQLWAKGAATVVQQRARGQQRAAARWGTCSTMCMHASSGVLRPWPAAACNAHHDGRITFSRPPSQSARTFSRAARQLCIHTGRSAVCHTHPVTHTPNSLPLTPLQLSVFNVLGGDEPSHHAAPAAWWRLAARLLPPCQFPSAAGEHLT